MLSKPIVRADRAAGSLPGGVGAREFAAREFPREDYRWVVAELARPSAAPAAGSGPWGRFRRWIGAPGETETDPETIAETASA